MNVGPTTTMHSRAVYCFVMAGIFLASLSLRRAVPLEAIPSAGHDDGLFVGLAGNLLAGDWLGSYSHLTLIKGMFYPLFIAVSHVLGLPVKVAEHLAYLGAALLLSAVAGRLIGSRLMVAGLFAVLAFNPFQWMGPQMARVVRDCLYGSLTVAVLALAARAFLVDAEAQRPLAGRSTYLVGLGVALGAFWLTREEREWILPALVLLFAYWLFHRARAWRVAGWSRGTQRIRLTAEAAVLAVPIAAFAAVVGTVDALNARAYGVFRDSDIRSSPFQSAIAALWRIQTADARPYVVVPKSARELVYAASPAAAELEPTLEGAVGDRWRAHGCALWPPASGPCNETIASWFLFELRDAAAIAGHHHSAKDADAYYQRLAAEINAACDSDRLSCRDLHHGLLPPLRWRQVADALRATWLAYRDLGARLRDRIEIPASSGPPQATANFLRITGGEGGPGSWHVLGWAYSTGARPSVSVAASSATASMTTTVKLSPGADVVAAFPAQDAKATRFDIAIDCGSDPCDLIIRRDGARDVSSPIADAKPGMAVRQPDLMLFFDSVSHPGPSAPEMGRIQSAQLSVIRWIAGLYAAVLPVALPAALALFILELAWCLYRRIVPATTVLAAGLLAALACRLAILGYAYATFAPVIEPRYLSPAYPLAIAFVVIVATTTARTVRARLLSGT